MFYELVWGWVDVVFFLCGCFYFYYVDGWCVIFNFGVLICFVVYGKNNVVVLVDLGLGFVVNVKVL